jgi:hypothetical protein
MGDDAPQPQPTQTTPKGLEIPVPTRAEWEASLKKVAPPAEHRTADAEPDERDGEQRS